MTAIERTAYPRFKQILSAKDLAEIYTPTPAERLVAHRSTKGRVAEVGFLVLLKTYQRLGRFVHLSEIPSSIIEHIAKPFEPQLYPSDLGTYDTSGTRPRHMLLIRALRHRFGYHMVEPVPLRRLAQIMWYDSLDTTKPSIQGTKQDVQQAVETIAWR